MGWTPVGTRKWAKKNPNPVTLNYLCIFEFKPRNKVSKKKKAILAGPAQLHNKNLLFHSTPAEMIRPEVGRPKRNREALEAGDAEGGCKQQRRPAVPVDRLGICPRLEKDLRSAAWVRHGGRGGGARTHYLRRHMPSPTHASLPGTYTPCRKGSAINERHRVTIAVLWVCVWLAQPLPLWRYNHYPAERLRFFF